MGVIVSEGFHHMFCMMASIWSVFSCCDIAENSRRGDDDGRTLILDTIQRVKDTCFRINQVC